MNEIVPYFEAGKDWSDAELREAFSRNGSPKKVQLMGLVAERSVKNPEFLELLRQEVMDEGNREKIFFGFIKFAWIPVLAVLEYGTEREKSKLGGWLNHWNPDERKDFFDYISNESEFLSWFSSLV